MNPCKSTLKCCGCMIMTQLLCLLLSLLPLILFILAFKFYLLDWGEDQIRKALNLSKDQSISSIPADVKAANNCSGCVFGNNLQWPTNTTGMQHFLDSQAGTTSTGLVATSLAAAAVTGTTSMLWASFFPSAASALSVSSGFYEMTQLVEQAQFIGLIGQLELRGAPEFLFQFSKELAWTNFNIPKSSSSSSDSPGRRRLFVKSTGETGVPHYAKMLNVQPKNLFFYTLMTFGLVIAALHVLYLLWIGVVSMMCKKNQTFGEIARKWYRKVIWATIVVLLLAQYIMSMSGFFYVYNFRENYVVGLLGLIAVIGFAVLLGVFVVSTNRQELKDVGTYEHEQRPFSAKYSAYYDEYNFDNRFFFVPRILLAVGTGAIVGMVSNPTTQVLAILGATVAYFVLLVARAPNLLRFLFYIACASVFMKIVLLCLMLMLVRDDYFPQSVRNNVSYAIIGINMFVFFLMFLRQAYVTIRKLITACQNKDSGEEDLTGDNRRDQSRQPLHDPLGDSSSTPPVRTNYARADSGWNDMDMEHGLAKQKASINGNPAQYSYGRQDPPNPASTGSGFGANSAASTGLDNQRRETGFSNSYQASTSQNRAGEQPSPAQLGTTEAVAAGVAVGAIGVAAAGAYYAHQRQQQDRQYNDPAPGNGSNLNMAPFSSFDAQPPGKMTAYELQTINHSSVPRTTTADSSFPINGRLQESSSFERMSQSSSYHESTLALVANASVAAQLSNRNMIDRRNENQSVDIDALSDALTEEHGYVDEPSLDDRESGSSDSDPNANSFVTATSAFTTVTSPSTADDGFRQHCDPTKVLSPPSSDERSYTTAKEDQDQSFPTFASAVSGDVGSNHTFASVSSIDIDEENDLSRINESTSKAAPTFDTSFASTESHETFASAMSGKGVERDHASDDVIGNASNTKISHADSLDDLAIAYIQIAGETATKHVNDVFGEEEAERESMAKEDVPDNDVDDGMSSDDLDLDTMDHIATLERFSEESFAGGYLSPSEHDHLSTPQGDTNDTKADDKESLLAQVKESEHPPAQRHSSAASVDQELANHDRSDSVQSDDTVDFYIAGRRGGRQSAPPRDDTEDN